jgi:ribonuclease D
VFQAVAAWRERTAQTRDQVRSRILKDEAIDEIAAQAPADAAAFDRLRSVPKGFGNGKFGAELASVIQAALQGADKAPAVERPAPAPQAPGAVVELLKVLLKARAEEANVAPKLIATVPDLEKLAASDQAESPLLQGWRREVFGEDALRLKRGELALVLEGSRVRVRDVPPK